MGSLAIEERRAVTRRLFDMAENGSAVADNSCSVAASERKATQGSFTSQRGEARYWAPALVYLLAYALAVHWRMPISDWLTAHLPF
jgi:hypothetical protein